jgi:hypothetical protein
MVTSTTTTITSTTITTTTMTASLCKPGVSCEEPSVNLLDKLKFFPFGYGVVKSADDHCKNDFSIDWQLPVIAGGIGIKSYEGATLELYKRQTLKGLC